MTVLYFEENLFQISRPTSYRQADTLSWCGDLDWGEKVHILAF